jgi:hypothetical protein
LLVGKCMLHFGCRDHGSPVLVSNITFPFHVGHVCCVVKPDLSRKNNVVKQIGELLLLLLSA